VTVVRAERPEDRGRIHQVEAAAFPTAAEADLFEALRDQVDPIVSLVAERDDRVIGHVCLSPVALELNPRHAGFGALGPIAVEPAAQRRGVGAALIEAGLDRARAVGWEAVFLVGDPRYYARFGFDLAAPMGFSYGDPHFDSALQVIELEPDGLAGCGGLVRYAPAFGQGGSD
jgi:putative acetyltransferase